MNFLPILKAMGFMVHNMFGKDFMASEMKNTTLPHVPKVYNVLYSLPCYIELPAEQLIIEILDCCKSKGNAQSEEAESELQEFKICEL